MPPPSSREQKNKEQLEDKHLFNAIAENYAKKDSVLYCQKARQLRLSSTLKNIKKPISSLLEIGCGAGYTAQYIQKDYEQYMGIDYSEELIDFANRNNSSEKAAFYCKDLKDFESKEKYQVILMIGVLHHMEHLEEVLKKLVSHLSPGGLILINEPQRGNFFIDFMRKMRKKLDPSYSSNQVDFSKKELVNLFSENGFDVKSFSQGVFSTPLAETLIMPKCLGLPLSFLFKFLDPAFERLLDKFNLGFLAWNIVLEAKPRTIVKAT